MTDPQLEGVLAACAAAPARDRTPWLVLADLLEERGDPRGPLLRSGEPHESVAWRSLDRQTWPEGHVPEWPTRMTVNLRVGERLDRLLVGRPEWRHPLLRLTARLRWHQWDAATPGLLAGLPNLDGVELLGHSVGDRTPDTMPVLRSLDALPGLRRLSLHGLAALTAEVWEHVAGREPLESLDIAHAGPVEPLTPLRTPHLRRLSLGYLGEHGDAVEPMWDETCPVVELSLTRVPFRLLEDLHLLRRLERLEIYQSDPGLAGAALAVALAGCGRLRTVSLARLAGDGAAVGAALASLPELRLVRVWPSPDAESALERLRAARPDVLLESERYYA